MSDSLILRGLDPANDVSLFREAYSWRKVSRLQHGKLSFEAFCGSTAMGLFNGEFLAVYVIEESPKGVFQMHFTSKPRSPREYLVAGGIKVTSWLVENGALEVSAMITARNRALRKFLEDCGYTLDRVMQFDDSPHEWWKYIAI